jgi:hypothetical protein
MSSASVILWIAGVALVVFGGLRARGPWGRYQALRDQEANVARYEAWRGGLRTHDDGPTGASLLMAEFRRQAMLGAGIAAVGVVLIVLGLILQ